MHNSYSAALLRQVAADIRQADRVASGLEKEAKRAHTEARQAEVDENNEQLETYLYNLRSFLIATLDVDDYIDFDALKDAFVAPRFSPGELAQEQPAPRLDQWLPPDAGGLSKLLPGAKKKHEAQVTEAQHRYEIALQQHRSDESRRAAELEEARAKHDSEVQALEVKNRQQHEQIERLKQDFAKATPTAVVAYFDRVLQASVYPGGFPRHWKMAFVPESRQLVVEFELPKFDVIPEVKTYKYIKTRDEITKSVQPASQRRMLYASVVAQVALRTIHEIFEADRTQQLQTIVFNGYVTTTDARTGKQVSPYLVTVRTTRDAFDQLDLEKVNPQECLKGLNASLSRSPSELAPVRPVVEFSMVDSRFVEESDILSLLDERPNLYELSPSEFESLITNLFEKMGLETRMTQASRDGGVDCVAWDQRPIFGGKVIIQAKRYKNTVGVSAVRDLFGTLQNEGGSKGILVTTSGYGKAAFEFANGKPIELLDGGNLLYLLKEHAGMDAKIEVPEDWVDPDPEL